MLSNREKMVAISSSTNEWPQNHQIDEKNLMASTTRRTEKVPGQELPQQQQHQQPLNCPRCDSSNTKFCYYNNYSLSQPRHFCKACKRYWTRGGTLRNVPVGGGCRKNKRVVKRPASASNSIDGSSSSTSSAAANPNNPHAQRQIDIINPLLLYGLSTNPSDMNLPFSSYNNSRISTTFDTLLPGYDLQPHQLNALGLGFSSGLVMSNDAAGDGNYRNGFNHTSSNNSLLSSYPFFIGSSSSSSPTTASLLASSLLHQQKFNNNGCVIKSTQTPSHLNNVASFEQIQMTANGGEAAARIGMKEVKAEERGGGQSRIMNWNQMEQIGGLPDPAATLYWNTNSVGAWHDDPSNVGSSVTSLI